MQQGVFTIKDMKVQVVRQTTCLISLKSKEKKPKKENDKTHFKRRWLERLGYECTDKKYRELIAEVKKNGRFLHKGHDVEHSVYLIDHDNFKIKVVYNPFKESLITVLM